MGMIIFFGMALFIFLLGLAVIGVTIYHWIKQSRLGKNPG